MSFTAQYRMVNTTRRALRPGALNLTSVAASVLMNAIAAAPGWRNLAIWAMPRLHPGRVPRLGPGRMPRRPRPPHLGGPRTARGPGPRRDQDVPLPFFGTERHGPLAAIPLNRVASISAHLAPAVDLNVGAARTALRKAVLAAQNGEAR